MTARGKPKEGQLTAGRSVHWCFSPLINQIRLCGECGNILGKCITAVRLSVTSISHYLAYFVLPAVQGQGCHGSSPHRAVGVGTRGSEEQDEHVFRQQQGQSAVHVPQVPQGFAAVAPCQGVGVADQRHQHAGRPPGLLHPLTLCLAQGGGHVSRSAAAAVRRLLPALSRFSATLVAVPTALQPHGHVAQPVAHRPASHPPDGHAAVAEAVDHAFEHGGMQGVERRGPEGIYVSQESACGGLYLAVGVSERSVQHGGLQAQLQVGTLVGATGNLGQED